MPSKKYRVELHDGRKFEVETDGEAPNEDDILREINQPSNLPDVGQPRFPRSHNEPSADELLSQAKQSLAKPPVYSQDKPSDEVTKATAEPDELLIKKGWNFATKPLTDAPTRFAKSVSDYINPHSETTGLRGIGSAYIEGLGQAISGLTSPLNLATAGLGTAETAAARYGLPQVARLANIGGRVASASMIPEGLEHAVHGKHLDEILSGLLEAGLGAHGMRPGVHETPKSIEEGGTEFIPPEYNQGPKGDIIDVRSPESNSARLLETGQRQLGIGDIGNSILDESGRPIAPIEFNRSEIPYERPPGPWDTNLSENIPTSSIDDIKYDAMIRNYQLRNQGIEPERFPNVAPQGVGSEFERSVMGEHGLPAEFAPDIFSQEEYPTTRPELQDVSGRVQEPDLMQQFQEMDANRPKTYEWPEAGGTFTKNAAGSDVLSPESTVSPEMEMANEMPPPDSSMPQRESLFSGETGAVGDVRGAREAREANLKQFKMSNPTPEKVRNVQEKGYTLDPKNPLNEDGSFNFVKGGGGGKPPGKGPILESDVADIEPPKNIKDKADPSIWRQLAELPRELMSVDLPFTTSAAFRQASPWIGTKNWFKAWVPSAKAYGSKAAYEAIQSRIENDPLVKPNTKGQSFLVDVMGVKLTDLKSINSREEFFRSELAEKIPIYGKFIGGSARAYTAFLNDLRLNQSRTLIRDAQAMGIDPFKDLNFAKQLGEFMNTTTGRGSLKTSIGIGKTFQKTIDLEHNAKLLSDVLFSPRLMMSRINMLNPQTYIMAPPMIRQQYAFAMMRSIGAWWTIAGLAKLAGAQVSMSPTSADFGKIKIGNTRLDPGAGFQQYLVLAARNAEGGNTSSTTGAWKPYGVGYKPETRGSTLQDFAANKMEPKLKLAYDLFFANPARPVYVGDRLLQMAAPMLAGDIANLVRDDPTMGVLFGIPLAATVGMGTQTYGRGSNFQDPTFLSNKYDFKFAGGPLGGR
jgi:hypothetical protein